jgi:hypothetical protein
MLLVLPACAPLPLPNEERWSAIEGAWTVTEAFYGSMAAESMIENVHSLFESDVSLQTLPGIRL